MTFNTQPPTQRPDFLICWPHWADAPIHADDPTDHREQIAIERVIRLEARPDHPDRWTVTVRADRGLPYTYATTAAAIAAAFAPNKPATPMSDERRQARREQSKLLMRKLRARRKAEAAANAGKANRVLAEATGTSKDTAYRAKPGTKVANATKVAKEEQSLAPSHRRAGKPASPSLTVSP